MKESVEPGTTARNRAERRAFIKALKRDLRHKVRIESDQQSRESK